MKKAMTICAALLAMVSLAGCGSGHHGSTASSHSSQSTSVKHHRHHEKRKTAAASSSAASASANSSSNASSTANSTDQRVIKGPNDAARLVAHAMAASDDLFHATPANGGFVVTQRGMSDKSFVHYDGSVTWSDGTTQPYAQVSAPENNELTNNRFVPEGN